jgi:hypothetical protein
VNSLGFLEVELGAEIASVRPIDLDQDGTLELAVTMAGDPLVAGLFDPGTFSWLDGPRILPTGVADWEVRTSDNGDSYDYYFVLNNSLFRLESRTQAVDSLWKFGYTPRSITVWGTDTNGEPVISALGDSTYSISGNGKFLRIHSLLSGATLAQLPGGDSKPRLAEGLPMAGENSMAIHYSRATFDSTPWVGRNHYYQWIYFVDEKWNVWKQMALPGWSTLSGPPADLWEIKHFDLCQASDAIGVTISWIVESSQPRIRTEIQPMYGACALDLSQEWSLSYWQRNLYAGMAIFDFDQVGGPEVILPLGNGTGWQRRNAETGVVLDVIPGLPPVALQSHSLFHSGQSDLFYINGSTLFIYKPDINTGVFDSPEVPQETAEAVTITAYPNPFNDAAVLTWVNMTSAASLTIHNILGQTIRTFDEFDLSGKSTLTWDGLDGRGRPVASGVYFARLATRDQVATAKLVMLR